MLTEQEEREKASFFALIRADPTNNDTRLVFADWCEEHGDMELAGMLRGGSEAWLRAFTEKFRTHLQKKAAKYGDPIEEWGCPPTYEQVMEAAIQFLDPEQFGLHLNFDTPDFVWDDLPEFWKHIEVMTGRSLPDELREKRFISCGC
jgi:uncharacterized protein (TIGR02996 family)